MSIRNDISLVKPEVGQRNEIVDIVTSLASLCLVQVMTESGLFKKQRAVADHYVIHLG